MINFCFIASGTVVGTLSRAALHKEYVCMVYRVNSECCVLADEAISLNNTTAWHI